MVWSSKNSKGEDIYIKGKSPIFYLSKDEKGALDSIPDGFKVERTKNGNLQLRKK
jgi:hypothetical protein